ncbi:hypothetical protein LzC2_28840 [Planctomycetes bacterium LzC2]|uniref:Uncharacterized protein n=1 Tax=Alienimonas chondri TaxID=2681879 RepID=A0ABX1VIY3_9PLAN|nr:hypothetical protein [Alienimonas chondri]
MGGFRCSALSGLCLDRFGQRDDDARRPPISGGHFLERRRSNVGAKSIHRAGRRLVHRAWWWDVHWARRRGLFGTRWWNVHRSGRRYVHRPWRRPLHWARWRHVHRTRRWPLHWSWRRPLHWARWWDVHRTGELHQQHSPLACICSRAFATGDDSVRPDDLLLPLSLSSVIREAPPVFAVAFALHTPKGGRDGGGGRGGAPSWRARAGSGRAAFDGTHTRRLD